MSCGRVQVNENGDIEVLGGVGEVLATFTPVSDERAFERMTDMGPVRLAAKTALPTLHRHLKEGYRRMTES